MIADENKFASFTKPNHLNDGLVFYYHRNNYYSQKVLMVLYEKNINFTPYEIDAVHGEQYSKWFLELNPKGEIPVLQNGQLIIPESSQILFYLENNFAVEKHKRLLPKYADDEKLADKVVKFCKLVNQIPIGIISIGSLMHSNLCSNPKPPFIGIIRESFLKSDENTTTVLKYFADKNPPFRQMLLRKADIYEKKRQIISDENEFHKLLNSVNLLLEVVEHELEIGENKWLCDNEITLADISLAVLLYRLDLLGLSDYFWGENKKPHLKSYFNLIQKRESFVKTLPSNLDVWKTMWEKSPPHYQFGVGLLGVSSIVLVGSLIYSKNN